ncbi:hypothetical protein ACFWWA_20605 [Streptomyces goshikiensis]|uniref:hypothetical protein n=1 Tax=Streptomyces goshikiensis TaxID=1942 RepID=UPI00365D3CA0
MRDAILASPAWPDIAAAMGSLDANGIDVARILGDAHAAGVGEDQAVAAVTTAAARAPAPAPRPTAATPTPATTAPVAPAATCPRRLLPLRGRALPGSSPPPPRTCPRPGCRSHRRRRFACRSRWLLPRCACRAAGGGR